MARERAPLILCIPRCNVSSKLVVDQSNPGRSTVPWGRGEIWSANSTLEVKQISNSVPGLGKENAICPRVEKGGETKTHSKVIFLQKIMDFFLKISLLIVTQSIISKCLFMALSHKKFTLNTEMALSFITWR